MVPIHTHTVKPTRWHLVRLLIPKARRHHKDIKPLDTTNNNRKLLDRCRLMALLCRHLVSPPSLWPLNHLRRRSYPLGMDLHRLQQDLLSEDRSLELTVRRMHLDHLLPQIRRSRAKMDKYPVLLLRPLRLYHLPNPPLSWQHHRSLEQLPHQQIP